MDRLVPIIWTALYSRGVFVFIVASVVECFTSHVLIGSMREVSKRSFLIYLLYLFCYLYYEFVLWQILHIHITSVGACFALNTVLLSLLF